MNRKYNIGISCIGSGVGQSVINSCRLSDLPIKTFGLGTNPMAYGLYDCDDYIYTPNIYSQGYVEELIKICLEHHIDLVIPGMDDEAHIFSKNQQKFKDANIKVIVADESLLNLCRDKEQMSIQLNKISPIFVKSYNKNDLIKALENDEVELPVIAKPRSGFASRSIEIIRVKEDISKISPSHIVQELAMPHKGDTEREYFEMQIKKYINPQVSEISIQIVSDENGNILGKMASYNKLNNGVPIEVLPYENELIWYEINKLLPEFQRLGLKGPFNLQGRLTDNGLKLFEMNARFTGITGLRAYMGFNEVELCIRSWLGLPIDKSKFYVNDKKFGIRQTADKSIDLQKNDRVDSLYDLINGDYKKRKRTILITGATGYLGRNLILKLNCDYKQKYEVWAFVRDKTLARKKLSEDIFLYDLDDLKKGVLSMGNVDILIHAGFARPFCEDEQIANSIEFSGYILRKAVSHQVASIINISSQSVYGQQAPFPWSEIDTKAVPNSLYGIAKYSVETLLEQLAYQHNQINYTSIRLGAVCGGADGLVETDLMSKLVKTALAKKDISIFGGEQIMERIDIRDAVNGLVTLLNNTRQKWNNVYNLGSARPIKLNDLGTKVAKNVAQLTDGQEVKVLVKEAPDINHRNFGLDITAFSEQFNWKPEHTMDDSIASLVNMFSK